MGCRTRKQAQWQSATRSLWVVVSSTLMALSGSAQHVAMNGVSNVRKCDSTDRITHQSAAQAEPLTAIGSTGPKGHQPALDSHPPQMTVPRVAPSWPSESRQPASNFRWDIRRLDQRSIPLACPECHVGSFFNSKWTERVALNNGRCSAWIAPKQVARK